MLNLSDEEIIEGILKEFAGLAAHPRKSGHEKAVSDYLASRLRGLGAQVHQDKVNNIIADVPASKGCETVPRTILQGHMDMVCVAKPGVAYDPLKDPIRMIREGNILRADGTSLGADDGIAAATFLFLLQQDFAHGPLRLIFTVDEEVHMTGSMNLDPRWLQDARYVINCDSEAADQIVVASAGSVHVDFTRKLTREDNPYDGALEIAANGFVGGHSGETINKGKSNAIPSQARALIALPADKMEQAGRLVAEEKASQQAVYGDVEKTLDLTAQNVENPRQVWSGEDTAQVTELLVLLHTGVFAMNQQMAELPDLSANIGTVKVQDGSLDLEYFPRSSSNERLEEFVRTMPIFAKVTGFAVKMGTIFSAWTENRNSVLRPAMERVHEEVMGRKPKIVAMHGGLETGFFYKTNPKLDLVSVGPNTHAIHSADESVELDSTAQVARIIAGTLTELTK